MANRKLTELPTLSPINFDSADLLYIVDVQTDISKKIPYSLLAGDSLISLSAYDSQNTLNVNYLSGSIESNTALIVALEGGEAAQGLNVAYLSGVIDLNTSDIATLSTDFNNADTATLAADVLQLSGDLDALSAAVLDIEDLPENFLSAIQFLSGAIDDNTATIQFLSGAIDDNTATIANIRTLSGFTGTVSTTTTLTATHFVPIIINGASYNLLLNQ